jgi:hypothetical protein
MAVAGPRSFSSSEVGSAILTAGIFQCSFFALLVWAGASSAKVQRATEAKPDVVPIAVQPVLDDLPLLKLGSKQKVKKDLPDIWKKHAPIPVKRYEERAAPSELEEDDPEEITETKLADKTHEAPPEGAELTKEAIPNLEEQAPAEAPSMNTEGAADGSKDGTETDPLKARALDQYKVKIASWFNRYFEPPVGAIPCTELKSLRAKVTVQVGVDREVTGFVVASPSGNSVFDARVQSTMQSLIGRELPPPPPLYPDILGSAVFPVLSGRDAPCQVESAPTPDTAPTPPSSP